MKFALMKKKKEIYMTLHMMCSKEKEKKLLNQRPGLLEQCKPLGQTEHIQRFNLLRHPLRQDLRQFQSQLKGQFQSQPLSQLLR
jgi:hypothetical protein